MFNMLKSALLSCICLECLHYFSPSI